MSDIKVEQPIINTGRRPVTRWKHRSSILLMLLGAVAIVVYLLRSGLAKQYEGLGAALCVVALGGFLIWHLVHLFTEQDAIDEQQFRAKPSSPQPNPAEQSDQIKK
jgi:hypothetical protein